MRLVDHVRTLIPVGAVTFVTIDEERETIERSTGWFADEALRDALGAPASRPLDHRRRGLVEAALERERPLLLPRVDAWEASPDLLAAAIESLGSGASPRHLEVLPPGVGDRVSAAHGDRTRARSSDRGFARSGRPAAPRGPADGRGGSRPRGDGPRARTTTGGGGAAGTRGAAPEARERGRVGLARDRRGVPASGRTRRAGDGRHQGAAHAAQCARR